ncbi:hypothetical protein L7F22_060194, partial [Adiantum nelumboides]|nr:hypothetical protein [Adiantum nelumboides]
MGYQSEEEDGCMHKAGKIAIRKAGEARECLEKQSSGDVVRGHARGNNSRAQRGICVQSDEGDERKNGNVIEEGDKMMIGDVER